MSKIKMKRFLYIILSLALVACLISSCSVELNKDDFTALESIINDLNQYIETESTSSQDTDVSLAITVQENGIYDQCDDVAIYIHTFGKLPKNYLTKDAARILGWEGGAVDKVIPNACIGGDVFGNYEEILPEKSGRIYYECDINTLGKDERGAKRIVYSNDGLIYYTDDHYESFTLLYGNEE